MPRRLDQPDELMTDGEWERFWSQHDARPNQDSDDAGFSAQSDDDESWDAARRLLPGALCPMPATTADARSSRSNRCGSCTACRAHDCGICKNCIDKPRCAIPALGGLARATLLLNKSASPSQVWRTRHKEESVPCSHMLDGEAAGETRPRSASGTSTRDRGRRSGPAPAAGATRDAAGPARTERTDVPCPQPFGHAGILKGTF